MSTKSRYLSGTQAFFDPQQNYEHPFAMAPLFYEDEFMAAGKQTFPTTAANGLDWVKKLVGAGTPTVAGVANAGGGAVQLALDATSEKQEGTFYWLDNKALDATKNLVIEMRAKLTVLPSAAGVQAVWGLSSAWIDGPDNAAQYIEFGATANGSILMRKQDATTQQSVAALNADGSAFAVLTTDWHTYRIEAIDPLDTRFYIDGVQYSGNGILPFAATGANAILQPYFSVYKPSGTGLATMQLDYFRAWSNRI